MNSVKSGWKTTEFWLTAFTNILGIVAATGAVTPDQSSQLTQGIIQLGGVIASVASAFGYSISRGMAKL